MPLKNKKAVIFDMDGTLIDSMWVWHVIDEEFLGSRGFEIPEGLQHDIEGMSFYETACYFKEHFSLDEDIYDIMDTWNRMAFSKYEKEVSLKKGVLKFLDYLKANDIKMGIATSNSSELALVCLKSLGIDEYFDVVATAGEVKNGKPQPDIYLHAADILNVRPEECLVFEDVPMGILSGKNAGMTVAAVDDDFSAHLNDKKKELADYFINDFDEFLNGIYEVCNG